MNKLCIVFALIALTGTVACAQTEMQPRANNMNVGNLREFWQFYNAVKSGEDPEHSIRNAMVLGVMMGLIVGHFEELEYREVIKAQLPDPMSEELVNVVGEYLDSHPLLSDEAKAGPFIDLALEAHSW